MSVPELDDVDRRIIDILQKDARTPYTEVAKELNVSDPTIHVRVRKLEEAGIIKGYTVVVNKEKLGNLLTAYVLVNVLPGTMEDVANKLAQVENVPEIYEIHGRNDILLKIRGKNIPTLRDTIIEMLRKIPGVTRTEVLTVFKTWKCEQ